MRRLRLNDDEDNEQCDTDAEKCQRRSCSPADRTGFGDAVDDRYETQGGSDGTGDVVRRISRRPRLAHERDCQKHSDDGDGGVDQQGPVPVGVLGEQAAGDKADRCAAAGDRTEDAERARTLLGLGECHRDERQRGRRQQCGEHALQRACTEEHPLSCRKATQERSPGESDEADDEHALATLVVSDASAEKEKAAESERVRRDDPLAVRVGHA